MTDQDCFWVRTSQSPTARVVNREDCRLLFGSSVKHEIMACLLMIPGLPQRELTSLTKRDNKEIKRGLQQLEELGAISYDLELAAKLGSPRWEPVLDSVVTKFYDATIGVCTDD